MFPVKPQLLKKSQGINYVVAKPSENVHLECTRRRGYPAPSYTWYQAPSSVCKDGDHNCKPQDNQWKKPGHVTEMLTSSPRNDTAFYKCIATNAAGQDTKLFAVVRIGML